jgi:hypothetical protein
VAPYFFALPFSQTFVLFKLEVPCHPLRKKLDPQPLQPYQHSHRSDRASETIAKLANHASRTSVTVRTHSMTLCLLFLFLSVSEAEPLDLGSQARAWEPVN